MPYDDNYVRLEAALAGTAYVNCSRISFPGRANKFLAAQAPTAAATRHFWHLVIQEGVAVVVMITRLEEGGRRKAEQYWPEEAGEEAMGPVLELGGGARVEYRDTSYQGTYFRRRFTLYLGDGGIREVLQVHSSSSSSYFASS